MQKFARIAALFGVIAVSMIAAGTVGNVAAASSPAVGHVYVNGNTAPFNTIAGFDRHADGTLTPLAGSPFAIGGRGTGTNLGSQGALQLSADGRYLLAVDAGSNEISVARIYNDGSLKAVGDPVSANGITPVSIAVHGDLVYVANTGAGGSNYTGFTLNAGGHLAALSNTT